MPLNLQSSACFCPTGAGVIDMQHCALTFKSNPGPQSCQASSPAFSFPSNSNKEWSHCYLQENAGHHIKWIKLISERWNAFLCAIPRLYINTYICISDMNVEEKLLRGTKGTSGRAQTEKERSRVRRGMCSQYITQCTRGKNRAEFFFFFCHARD